MTPVRLEDPMLPTLAELLTLPAFAGAEVVSGHAHLTQPVTWVHVSEVADAARFLTGGELLLSTGSLLARMNEGELEGFVASLAQRGAHGLVLELVQVFREVPPALLGASRLHGLPLIVFRQEVSFAALTRAAHARILNHGGPALDPSLAPLLDALAETGRSVAFLRAQLGPLLNLPARPRSTLLGTLDALLTTNFNMAETARRLGVRRQTVYYRLEQLRAMLPDLDEPRRQLGLHLALELTRSEAGEALSAAERA
ncbi:PucR family transcriptional regulator [Deinococcus soli (ex Cha et al. 2016)]|uniref:Purine catabolism regulator n=2 Tax=Deinococcus soli (ex Cha et al. 2016) TaxID=1309411 RepID=A0AAE3XB96_9DEIO|nr:PucR family transcriptional regulator [Deinococcus soli (ex Cha et al. 2016)]MDR6217769.1 purine catabolism regulator [Deinococcus soli (ex Cha et al. 2016)]MDR6328019.1 purine catabolism regulator [Deinococcus soli (ex Cha et al. 2016)]MDR6750871.1 purine catabolism regulator [Deinococcus soli (ex Cha et al. 2016)]